jgi:hypothetical protein
MRRITAFENIEKAAPWLMQEVISLTPNVLIPSAQHAPDCHMKADLFMELTNDRLFGCFVFVDSTAGKRPAICSLT